MDNSISFIFLIFLFSFFFFPHRILRADQIYETRQPWSQGHLEREADRRHSVRWGNAQQRRYYSNLQEDVRGGVALVLCLVGVEVDAPVRRIF